MAPESTAVDFRLTREQREVRRRAFNLRAEIVWFGFEGRFEEPDRAVVACSRFDAGLLGGGGTRALNGGVIAAGFDAAVVLAGLGQYDVDVVVTLELSVQFLHLAPARESLAFEAHITRSARHFSFVRGVLVDREDRARGPLAMASAMVAPR